MLRFTKLLAILLISSVVFIACTLGDNAGGGGSSDPGFQGVPQINYANYTLTFNPATDVIQDRFKNASNANTTPSGLVLSPDGRFLFVSERGPNGDSGTKDGAIVVMSRDVNTGALTFLQRYSHGYPVGGTVTVDLQSANRAAVSPDGKYLYVPGRVGYNVMIFSINQATGALTPIQKITPPKADAVAYIVQVVITPDGAQVMIPTSDAATGFVTYDRDKSTGMLTNKRDISLGTASQNRTTYMAINSAGTRVYVLSQIENCVYFLTRDTATGDFTLEETHKGQDGGGNILIAGMYKPEAILLSHDEKTLYVGGQETHGRKSGLVVFNVNPTTGALTHKKTISNDSTNAIKDKDGNDVTISNLADIIDIQESAGGNKLYVGAHDGNAIFTFDRNTSTGALTFNNKMKNDDHLVGVFTLFISPNGQYIYASLKGSSTKPGGIAILNYR